MSNMAFTIDAIPTPKIDLASAFEADLLYYVKNKKMPPLGRSALRQMEEKLNSYLKYVNENFIQEGFSASSPSVSVAMDTKMALYSNNGSMTVTQALVTAANLTISPEAKANLHFHWALCGQYAPATEGAANGTLTAEMWVDNVKQRAWRQSLTAGWNTMGAAACYANQPKGSHVLQLKLTLDFGALSVSAGDHYAYGYGQIVR
jgi:hypothetical protein